MKKLLCAALAACMLLGLCACRDSGTPTPKPSGSWEEAKKNAAEITVYVDASNIYGSYIKGSDEAYVKDAIEKKFYEDTGNAVNFQVNYESHATFNTKFGGVMTTGKWDMAVSYLGQAGLDEVVLKQDVSMDLADLLDNYEHIGEAIAPEVMNATTTLTGEVVGIPSSVKSKTKGILIRKDYMTKAGYTEDKAEAAASGGKLKFCQTIDDFTDMMRKMKAETPACTMPLIGNSYDIEFAITAGACGTPGYQYKSVIYNDDGSIDKVVPGWLSEGYDKVLGYEYLWQKEGLWEADNQVKTKEQRITDYSNGKGAIYCVDTNILELIDVARQVKAVDKSAEFTILGPLDAVDARGKAIENSGAFVEVSKATDCMIINKRSDKAELILAYFDWLYSDVKNYELCSYGIEGEHWVDAGEGYYAFPAGKEDRYLTNPPYSGVFKFLHNDDFAYRLFNNYTEEERGWIEKVESAKTIANPTDCMLFYNMTAAVANGYQTAENNFYLNCPTKAWNASADPAVTYPEYSAMYFTQAAEYIEWLTQQYKLYIAQRG